MQFIIIIMFINIFQNHIFFGFIILFFVNLFEPSNFPCIFFKLMQDFLLIIYVINIK